MSSSTQREKATGIVEHYRNKPGHHEWSHIDPDELSDQLNERIADPYCMKQKDSGWCGPTAVCASLAKDAPDKYAMMVIDLVRHGQAVVKHAKHGGLKLHPPRELWHYNFKETEIAAADWVPLSSLRDSLRPAHRHFKADDFLNSDMWNHGHCHPKQLTRFYRKLGYREVNDLTSDNNLAGPYLRQFIHNAKSFLDQHYRVTMRTNSNMLKEKTMHERGKKYGNGVEITAHSHWVDLIEPIVVDGPGDDAEVSFTVFSWGEHHHSKKGWKVQGLTLDEFGINFFGFISAKY
jgi:hypothetical protein